MNPTSSAYAIDRNRGAERKTTRLRPDMRFEELVQAWNEARRPAAKSLYATERVVAHFIDLVGDLPVNEIVSGDLFDYRDAIASLPRAMSLHERRLGFTALIEAFATEAAGRSRVKPATVH